MWWMGRSIRGLIGIDPWQGKTIEGELMIRTVIHIDEDKCTGCGLCASACHEGAIGIVDGKAKLLRDDFCDGMGDCLPSCPTGAITLDSHDYTDFQEGMAICTKTVLDTFAPGNTYFINVLTQITALCDCWGMTTPSLVPDIGIMAGEDIVAVERASIDAIKIEDLIPAGIPSGMQLSGHGHLFEQLHGKNPFIQLEKLEKYGLGTQEYELQTVR